MRGGFRESQVEMFDAKAQKTHDDLFWYNWTNGGVEDEDKASGSIPASNAEFAESEYATNLEKSGMTASSFLVYLRGVIQMLYSMQDVER